MNPYSSEWSHMERIHSIIVSSITLIWGQAKIAAIIETIFYLAQIDER